MAAALAGWLTARAGLAGADARMLVACAAGAGLAAVYNVPLAGVLFTLEALLRSVSGRSVAAAIATTAVATGVSRLCLGDVMQYDVPRFDVDESLVAWSLVAGPVIGLAAFVFRRAGEAAGARLARHDGSTIVLSLAVFAALGLLAGPFPELLGNGKGPALLGFDGGVTPKAAMVLFGLKAIVVFATIRAGAYGGLLTPASPAARCSRRRSGAHGRCGGRARRPAPTRSSARPSSSRCRWRCRGPRSCCCSR